MKEVESIFLKLSEHFDISKYENIQTVSTFLFYNRGEVYECDELELIESATLNL
ncbi:MAG: hypothetical protein QW350_05105 [Candidatus Aenigmatarchaeota archaeon]